MFDEHRQKKAQREQAQALARWQEQRNSYAELLNTARTFPGTTSSEIVLKAKEAVFFKVTGVGLIEERRGPGQYQGRSSGVSVPIGSIGGRSVRYHVGASRGTYVQGTPTLTTIDTGTVLITNARVVFVGGRQTRECAFAKLIGFHHDHAAGSTTFSVSNRQKPTVIHYGPKLSGPFDFRLDLALAHYRGTVPQLIGQLTNELAGIDAHRPALPPAG